MDATTQTQTTTIRCPHATYRQVGRDYPFFGPVYSPGRTDENRVAHGNIVGVEECDACGARRYAARNNRQVELSAWGPSAATRAADARLATATAIAALAAVPRLVRRDGAELWLDCEGWVVGTGTLDEVRSLYLAAPVDWRALAVLARRAVLAAEGARRE